VNNTILKGQTIVVHSQFRLYFVHKEMGQDDTTIDGRPEQGRGPESKQLPVHVTNHTSRIFDAERPPSNRQSNQQISRSSSATKQSRDCPPYMIGMNYGGRTGSNNRTWTMPQEASGDSSELHWTCVSKEWPRYYVRCLLNLV
jgi:hypothetical protein